jgi:hypothetical protein
VCRIARASDDIPDLRIAGAAGVMLHIEPLFGCDPGSAKYPSSNPWGLGGGK